MGYHWNWLVFLQPVGTGEPTTYLGWIVTGLGATVGISLAGWAIALVAGVTMGIVRTLPGKALFWCSAIYVALFRNIPLIVQFFLCRQRQAARPVSDNYLGRSTGVVVAG